MNILAKILGHTGKGEAWDCTVTYQDGSTGTMHFWADDIREALKLCLHWLPVRELPATEIVFKKRTNTRDSGSVST